MIEFLVSEANLLMGEKTKNLATYVNFKKKQKSNPSGFMPTSHPSTHSNHPHELLVFASKTLEFLEIAYFYLLPHCRYARTHDNTRKIPRGCVTRYCWCSAPSKFGESENEMPGLSLIFPRIVRVESAFKIATSTHFNFHFRIKSESPQKEKALAWVRRKKSIISFPSHLVAKSRMWKLFTVKLEHFNVLLSSARM